MFSFKKIKKNDENLNYAHYNSDNKHSNITTMSKKFPIEKENEKLKKTLFSCLKKNYMTYSILIILSMIAAPFLMINNLSMSLVDLTTAIYLALGIFYGIHASLTLKSIHDENDNSFKKLTKKRYLKVLCLIFMSAMLLAMPTILSMGSDITLPVENHLLLSF